MNSAYITLTSALAKEEVIKKLHRTPPFNLMVTPIASCSQEDGPATFEREEALGDENNNAEEIGEDEFVFGSPSVLDVSCDEVKPVVKVNEDLRLLKQAHFAWAMLSFSETRSCSSARCSPSPRRFPLAVDVVDWQVSQRNHTLFNYFLLFFPF